MNSNLKKVFCADVRMINNSGIGVYIHHFIDAILANSEYVVILIGRKQELSTYFPSGVYQHVEASFPIYSIDEQLKLPRLIPKCDVFWSPHYNVPILPIRANRFLVMVPDVFHLAFYGTLSLTQKIYAKVVMNVAVRKADRVLTISKYSKEEITRFTGIKPETIRVVYLGIDTTLFLRINAIDSQKRIQSRYNTPEKFVLFVGNVKPNKNLKALLNAFNILIKTLPDYRLLIVGKKEGFITGDSDLSEALTANFDLQERVSFTGYVDFKDLPILYSMASVFAFPSIYEGFGFPPLEAMACGCPVVASDRASIPEICGDAAFYTDPTNIENFHEALHKVITDEGLRSSLIDKGYKQVALYNWNKAGKQFISIVNELTVRD